jgi:uncharacterized protein (DUF1778 family)
MDGRIQIMSHKAAPTETARSGLINIRISAADRAIIDRAAKVAGKSRSEFMLQAARQAAQETLLDTTLFAMDGMTFKRFKAMLDAPARPNERLRALMGRQAPWEHDVR